MGRTPRGAIALAQRRQQVADLYLQGWTQGAIAKETGVAQGTVCNDLKVIRQMWKESAVDDFEVWKQTELRRLERVEREAWSAWERSQKPAQEARFQDGAANGRSQKTVRNQYGDPRFLEVVLKCVSGRRSILGLDAQPQVVENHVSIHLSTEERNQHINALLAELRSQCLPDVTPESQAVLSQVIEVENDYDDSGCGPARETGSDE